VSQGRKGTRDPMPPLAGPHGVLTCLPNKDLLRGTQGALTHSVVHTHPNLIPPVLVQVCGRQWGRGNTVVTGPAVGEGRDILAILDPCVKGQQKTGRRWGLLALGDGIVQLETERGSINSSGCPGQRVRSSLCAFFPQWRMQVVSSHISTWGPTHPHLGLLNAKSVIHHWAAPPVSCQFLSQGASALEGRDLLKVSSRPTDAMFSPSLVCLGKDALQRLEKEANARKLAPSCWVQDAVRVQGGPEGPHPSVFFSLWLSLSFPGGSSVLGQAQGRRRVGQTQRSGLSPECGALGWERAPSRHPPPHRELRNRARVGLATQGQADKQNCTVLPAQAALDREVTGLNMP
jgi:hypothetical protein